MPRGDFPGNPAGYIVDYIQQGFTQTEALREFRDAGGHIRDSSWGKMWGQVSDLMSRSEQFAGLNPDVIPSSGDYGEIMAGSGGKYVTHVKLLIRDRETGDVRLQDYDYFSDSPHTPAEGYANAFADFTDADQEAEYGEQVLGGVPTWVAQTVPYEA